MTHRIVEYISIHIWNQTDFKYNGSIYKERGCAMRKLFDIAFNKYISHKLKL